MASTTCERDLWVSTRTQPRRPCTPTLPAPRTRTTSNSCLSPWLTSSFQNTSETQDSSDVYCDYLSHPYLHQINLWCHHYVMYFVHLCMLMAWLCAFFTHNSLSHWFTSKHHVSFSPRSPWLYIFYCSLLLPSSLSVFAISFLTLEKFFTKNKLHYNYYRL